MHGLPNASWRDYLEKARGQFLELARPDVRFVAIARGQRDDSPQPPGSGKIESATQDLAFLGGWTLGPDPADARRQARFSLHGSQPIEAHAAGRPPNATAAFRHAITVALPGFVAGGPVPLETTGMSGGTAELATRAWIRALFDLCWDGSSPNLRAPRVYWAQMLHDGLVLDTICECPALIAEQWPIGETPPLNPLEAAMNGPSPRYAHWYAILPDVALASATACDFLLSYQPRNPVADAADNEDPIDPQTAGLVLSALEQGRKISPRCSAISVPPAKPGHVFEFTYPAGNDQAKFDALDRLYALLDLEIGVERKAALRGLIARVAVARDISRVAAANLSLAEFVRAAQPVPNGDSLAAHEPAASPVANHGDAAILSRIDLPFAEAADPKGQGRKRPGRRKADFETMQREAGIADDWAQAKGAGTYKPEFARDIGLTTTELDRLLDRVAKRRERAS